MQEILEANKDRMPLHAASWTALSQCKYSAHSPAFDECILVFSSHRISCHASDLFGCVQLKEQGSSSDQGVIAKEYRSDLKRMLSSQIFQVVHQSRCAPVM